MTAMSITAAVGALGAADVRAVDSAGCAELLQHVRRTRGWLDAVEARITSRMRELAQTVGAAPAADEHGRHCGVSAAEGRRKERRSKTLDDAPSFGDALAEGAISAEHVDGLANATARLDDDLRERLLGSQGELVAEAASMTPEQFARTCRDRVRELERDNGIERNTRQRRETFLSRKLNPFSGMIEGRYAFHPELGNQIFSSVDKQIAAMIAAGERHGDAEFVNRTFDRNRLAAEALGELVAGGHQQVRPIEADVTLIIDAETLASGELHSSGSCETSDGLEIPPESIRRLLCNGTITPVILGVDGVPINVGHTIRNATRAQRRALRAIYRHCAFAGCDVAFERCEVHHIHWWEHGGRTDLHNLLPLCSRHHHVVHEGGWELQLAPDRQLTIVRPDGQIHASCRPDIDEQRRQRRRRRRTAA